MPYPQMPRPALASQTINARQAVLRMCGDFCLLAICMLSDPAHSTITVPHRGWKCGYATMTGITSHGFYRRCSARLAPSAP
ncbi:hypothetical protein IE81DRAFT_322340 [Ceraceosorus guamensis]|uniref:Uncharacterized protein n=1 Tax=Ceraceosorus guamensis TaxID=1522189 RepID=A0A316W184_9BASI|nr:hypothetical protein IE81DRAFT_322340 [Ceraceosorus guamensis]PWN43482.1 hypothetical protein IE81DRAFT_322340 [Ceraceosorus guamensis]